MYIVAADEAVGMTIHDLEERFKVRVEQAAHLEKRIAVTPELILEKNYRLALQGGLGAVFQAGHFIGEETTNLSAMGFINEERDVVVTRKDLKGQTLAETKETLDLKRKYGVNATRLFRLDQEIEMYPQTEIHMGDVVRLVGESQDVARAADHIGYSLVPSRTVDYVYLGLATGPQAVAQIKQYGVMLPIIGFFAALPCLVMVFYGRFVLKMNPIIICGAITGNLTCTPGLNGVMDIAKSNTPVLGYTVSYAISNVLLTFLGPIIVFAV